MSIPNAQPRLLPATIEGATARYLHSYETYFKGPKNELDRLKGYAEAKLRRLRRKAPTFYENKLFKMVNQAASDLLICDTKTKQGFKDFNDVHKNFLKVLDGLTKGQPPGDVDFQTEKDRFKQRDQLIHQLLKLREERDKLISEEFDIGDLGEEKSDSKYSKNMFRLERVEAELKRVSILLATMEGEKIEPEITFELKVPQASTVRRCLNDEQLKKLEALILEFRKSNSKRSTVVDKSVIDKLLGKLELDSTKFTKDEITDISKDLLDAYRKYFRDLETKSRNESHEQLLKNRHLKPKEGLLLKDPDDVPEDIKQEFERTKLQCARQTERVMDKFSNMPSNDSEEDDIEDDSSDKDAALENAQAIIKQNINIYTRIKEEPRDDYEDDAPSEDEVEVDDNLADDVEQTLGITCRSSDNYDNDIMESSLKTYHEVKPAQHTTFRDDVLSGCTHLEVAKNLEDLFRDMEDETSALNLEPKVKRLKSPTISKSVPESKGHSQKRKQLKPKQKSPPAREAPQSSPSKTTSQEDIDVLGTIEPSDKVIDLIEIDDDA